jgi:hypothetical protein
MNKLIGCPEHQYPDSENTCAECDESCRGCYGPGEDECDWCYDDQYWMDGQCLSCDISEYYDYDEQQCLSCLSYNCEDCYYWDYCTLCLPNYFFFNFKCYDEDSCPIGTEPNSDSAQCVLYVPTFKIDVFEEDVQDTEDQVRIFLEMKFNESPVESESYLELAFPNNLLLSDESTCFSEGTEGSLLSFVSFEDNTLLYIITEEIELNQLVTLECTEITMVQF